MNEGWGLDYVYISITISWYFLLSSWVLCISLMQLVSGAQFLNVTCIFTYLLIYLFIYLLFRLPCSCIFSCSSNCYSYLCKCVHTMTKLSSPKSVCKIQQFFHLHMCVKYGILKKQILTILEKQSVVFSGKIFFKI